MAVQTNTIQSYFGKEYDMGKFYQKINSTLLSYKFPLQICLSSTYLDSILLGTLEFVNLDRNGYPTYSGNVVESNKNITYSTELNFVIDRWTFILIDQSIDVLDGNVIPNITINSLRTTSLNPTKVDYNGISRPTTGACKVGGGSPKVGL